MADFRWSDIYRITKAVSRDVPKNQDELLSWISTYHFSALAFSAVHQRSKRQYNWGATSPFGRTVYETVVEMVAAYVDVIAPYPQFQFQEFISFLVDVTGTPVPRGLD